MTAPLPFLVSEVVSELTDQARTRTPWHVDEVTVSPNRQAAHVSLLVDNYPGGNVRVDVEIKAFWVTRAPEDHGPEVHNGQ